MNITRNFNLTLDSHKRKLNMINDIFNDIASAFKIIFYWIIYTLTMKKLIKTSIKIWKRATFNNDDLCLIIQSGLICLQWYKLSV